MVMQATLSVVNILLFTLAGFLLIPFLMFFIECVAALFPVRSKSGERSSQFRLAVLIPAHNEADSIATTLQSVIPQLTKFDEVVVIADNCTDLTAEIARNCGVQVIERVEPDVTRRGKGYALDFGFQYLSSHPPDVVVTIDSDCVVTPGTIAHIAQTAYTTGRPVQSTYLISSPQKPSLKDSISALAVTVKNLVRPAGLHRLGFPCLLTGAGMAFPWSAICSTSVASSNLVEDMKWGLDLAIANYPPVFCQEALTLSVLPQQTQSAKSQRTRWEHGHLNTLLTQVPRLLKASLKQKRFDLLVLALDLLVPPLSLLVMVWMGMMAIAMLATLVGASPIPALLLGVAGVLMLIAILVSWAKYCRNELPLKTLLAVPLYILWKIPLYFAFLVKPQKVWVRTERDGTR